MWQDRWDDLEHNKLHSIKLDVALDISDQHMVICLLVILDLSVTIPSDYPFSVKHVLLDRVDFANTWQNYSDCDNVFNLCKTLS